MTPNTVNPATCEVPVLFTSTEGQTALIAIRLATVLRESGLNSEAIDITGPDAARLDWSQVRGVIVGASLHAGKHQKAAAAFVHAHTADVNRVPSAFFSVSLSAASSNQTEVEAAARIAREFPGAHGWRPNRIESVAGRLAYREYGFLTRLMMKWIARKEGAPTDTSRDYELTNWEAVDRLGREMAALVEARREVMA